MSKSVTAKRYPDIESVKSSGEPGAYTINDVANQTYKNLWFNNPDDASEIRRIPIGGSATDGEKPWGWNGNEEKPTLTPSVFLDPDLPGWHGWLRDGVWVSV